MPRKAKKEVAKTSKKPGPARQNLRSEWKNEIQREILKLKKEDPIDDDNYTSSPKVTKIKCEPTFETVFACVSNNNTLMEEFVEDESKTDTKNALRSNPEIEKLESLQTKIDLVTEELDFERLRGKELEKELEKVNKNLKTVAKLYGFEIDCF